MPCVAWPRRYSPTISQRIVPTTVQGVFARPCECYTEKSPWPDVFFTAHPTQLSASARAALRLPHRPPLDLVLRQLAAQPPSDKTASDVKPLHVSNRPPPRPRVGHPCPAVQRAEL